MDCQILKDYNNLKKSPFLLSKGEVKAVLYWLSIVEKEDWIGGSYAQIESIYNRLNGSIKTPVIPKKWKWKKKELGLSSKEKENGVEK